MKRVNKKQTSFINMDVDNMSTKELSVFMFTCAFAASIAFFALGGLSSLLFDSEKAVIIFFWCGKAIFSLTLTGVVVCLFVSLIVKLWQLLFSLGKTSEKEE